jgi:hypothetical protein
LEISFKLQSSWEGSPENMTCQTLSRPKHFIVSNLETVIPELEEGVPKRALADSLSDELVVLPSVGEDML